MKLLVPCASKKAIDPEPELCFRNHVQPYLEESVASWAKAISEEAKRLTAESMYKGPNWSILRRLIHHLAISSEDVLIASAGLGLVKASSAIPSYGATFAPKHADSVRVSGEITGLASNSKWWSLLRSNVGVHEGAELQVDLSIELQSDFLLVLLPKSYLGPISSELASLPKQIVRKIVILTTYCEKSLPVENQVFIPGSLQRNVGSTMHTLLSAVTLNVLLQSQSPVIDDNARSPGWWSSHLSELKMKNMDEALIRKKNVSLTDDQIFWFIVEKHLSGTSATRLLRELRVLGYACEQSRFRRIYQLVKSGYTN